MMPKLRMGPEEKRSEILTAWQRYAGYSDDGAAKALQISRSTLYHRRKNGDWKLRELHLAIRMFRIPPDDALSLLTMGCRPMEDHMERMKRRQMRGLA